MKCVDCGSDELMAVITITVMAPLAQKGGSIKASGLGVTQLDIKAKWDKDEDGQNRATRGPIVCVDCGCRMVYIAGSTSNPHREAELETVSESEPEEQETEQEEEDVDADDVEYDE